MCRRSSISWLLASGGGLLLPVPVFAQIADINDAINKAGRQRMLSQRIAANYLCASWGVQIDTSAAEMAKSSEEFTKAHDMLKNSPETSASIKSELQLVESQFAFFEIALKSLKPGSGDVQAQGKVFTTSERILQVMDGVTGMYSKLA